MSSVPSRPADGMRYAPVGRAAPVCAPGEFRFAATGLDHGHIYGMCQGLVEAGGELVSAYDPDEARLAEFLARFPGVRSAGSEEEVLSDDSLALIACAAVPADRAAFALRAMASGKDFFVDKPALTTLAQLAAVQHAVERSGRKFAVYFSERLHVEAAVFAGALIGEGAVGRVVQVMSVGPHRLNADTRPPWAFDRSRTGGILCDLGSHQVEQFLSFAGASNATVSFSRVANYANKSHPDFEDFGECALVGDNGAVGYFRVDWLTPSGLSAWGDGRTIVLGTEGFLELRKYVDLARDSVGDHVFVVDADGERHFPVHGQVGFPFFGQLIRDCLDRTETAMTQAHIFRAVALAIEAQAAATFVER